MGQLIDGRWHRGAVDRGDESGAYRRSDSAFRARVTADGSSDFPAEAGRYHLIVSPACPWSHRTMLLRMLKRLEGVVSMNAVEPLMLEDGWTFAEPDPVTGARRLYEVYAAARRDYTGKASVPVLWDRQRRTIVNNESSEIIRMFNREFAAFTAERTDYYPAPLAAQIDAINERVYREVNDAVYRAGFATRQEIYEREVTQLFSALDWLEAHLDAHECLVGNQLTEADWRLFPTLVRFDAVYFGHFKCNRRHVYQYPALWRFVRRLYAVPGVAATVDIDHYKRHYYGSHRSINPNGIVPVGPDIDFRASKL